MVTRVSSLVNGGQRMMTAYGMLWLLLFCKCTLNSLVEYRVRERRDPVVFSLLCEESKNRHKRQICHSTSFFSILLYQIIINIIFIQLSFEHTLHCCKGDIY